MHLRWQLLLEMLLSALFALPFRAFRNTAPWLPALFLIVNSRLYQSKRNSFATVALTLRIYV